MNLFGRPRTNGLALLALAIAILAPPVAAQLSGLTVDGWHSWAVEPVASVPRMCCHSWNRGFVSGDGCDLDNAHGGFSTSSDRPRGDVRIFVRMAGGSVADIRTLSAGCPVRTSAPVNDLGRIANAESVAWLSGFVEPGGPLASEAIFAIAVHAGDEARRRLVATATSPADRDNREDAIFWMAQARAGESARALRRFIFEDPDPDIREHAAFAYAQSAADDVGDVLIRQGRRDADPDVRSQAWFWLAQSEAPESERAIGDALREDEDDGVRQEAVFALSQLPEDRAVKALAAVLEDESLGRRMREQALFWLAQSGSQEAFQYLDDILSDN